MPPKRKGRERVQCMTCQAVINGDEQNSHKRRIHQNAAVKFRIYMEDSKQPKLSFGSSKSKEANDMDDDEIVSPAAGGDERVIEPSDIEDVDKVSQAAADDEERSNEPNDREEVVKVPQVEGDEETTVEGGSSMEVVAEPSSTITNHDNDQVDEVDNVTIHEDDDVSPPDDHETEVCLSGIPKEPFQPILAKYNPMEYGKYTRDFLPAWYKLYPWLEFDVEAKSATCYSCKYFSVKPSTWSFNKWKQTERIKIHADSNEHKLSFMKWIDFKLSSGDRNSVLTQVNSHHAENVLRNREYLKKMIEVAAYLGKQNIPFRADKEDRSDLTNDSDTNRGNFLELVSLISKDNVTVNSILSSSSSSDSPRWLAPHHQN